jgi:hypothetical protein
MYRAFLVTVPAFLQPMSDSKMKSEITSFGKLFLLEAGLPELLASFFCRKPGLQELSASFFYWNPVFQSLLPRSKIIRKFFNTNR